MIHFHTHYNIMCVHACTSYNIAITNVLHVIFHAIIVVHAEMNAIIFKNCVDLEGCTLYTTLFPCHECAKAIIRSGIKEVYYLMDHQDVSEGKELQWNDDSIDTVADWEAQKKYATFMASRCLLKEKYSPSGTPTPPQTSEITSQSHSAQTAGQKRDPTTADTLKG